MLNADPESRLRHRLRSLRTGRGARTGIAYAAAGWLLVQVASTMLVPLGLPDWGLRLLIVVVIVGFFVTVAIALGLDAVRPEPAVRPASDDPLIPRQLPIPRSPYSPSPT